MAAGLCYGSRGGAALAFHHQLGAYDTATPYLPEDGYPLSKDPAPRVSINSATDH